MATAKITAAELNALLDLAADGLVLPVVNNDGETVDLFEITN